MSDSTTTVDTLRRMMQRVLDGQEHQRAEGRHLRRELARIDRAIAGLQRTDLDRLDALGDLEEKVAALARRLERLEDEP